MGNSLDKNSPAYKEMSSFVDDAIKSHAVTVFSKSSCPYCVKAKSVLSKYQLSDVYIVELDGRSDGASIQDYLLKLTGGRTVSRTNNLIS